MQLDAIGRPRRHPEHLPLERPARNATGRPARRSTRGGRAHGRGRGRLGPVRPRVARLGPVVEAARAMGGRRHPRREQCPVEADVASVDSGSTRAGGAGGAGRSATRPDTAGSPRRRVARGPPGRPPGTGPARPTPYRGPRGRPARPPRRRRPAGHPATPARQAPTPATGPGGISVREVGRWPAGGVNSPA